MLPFKARKCTCATYTLSFVARTNKGTPKGRHRVTGTDSVLEVRGSVWKTADSFFLTTLNILRPYNSSAVLLGQLRSYSDVKTCTQTVIVVLCMIAKLVLENMSRQINLGQIRKWNIIQCLKKMKGTKMKVTKGKWGPSNMYA